LWRRSLTRDRSERRTSGNDAATPTPVTDGTNVYAFFSEFGLVAYGPEGVERWRTPLGPFNPPHGMATSPILCDGKVVLVADQVAGSYVAAFDTADGRLIWKTERPSLAGGYSTPVTYQPEGGPLQVIVSGPLELASYSAATGQKLWSVGGMGAMPIAVPAVGRDTFYVLGGSLPPFEVLSGPLQSDRNKDGKISPDEFPDPAFRDAVRAIDRASGNGDGAVDAGEWNKALGLSAGSNDALVAVHRGGTRWRVTKSLPTVPSVLLYRDVLYLVKDGGILTTLDPAKGVVLKQGRLKGALDRYFASPVASEGKVYFVSETGKVVTLRAGGPDWEVLAVNDLGDECYATPAVADRRLYVRTRGHLYAFGRVAG
jgi:outer membrane protein assembly factor BamB